MEDLSSGPLTRRLADIVRLAQALEPGRRKYRLDAYLLNMATRLIPMRRVLANTGSIYLHCNPTASHYLKLVMDAIFGTKNFRNEIIWAYRGGGTPENDFAKKHDVIFRYSKTSNVTFNVDAVRVPYSQASKDRLRYRARSFRRSGTYDNYEQHPGGKHPEDWWVLQPIMPSAKERLGYPTQKPLALLERIISASSNVDDIVLDPFCGCGTAAHAAESLGRRWVGVDISPFATGLVRNRILNNFPTLTTDDVLVRGIPASVADAKSLATRDKLEFEKWVCGAIGAEGMFHEPGTPGPDQGVDGVLPFYPMRFGEKPEPEYAIVQVKGGNVTVDSVKALKTTIDNFGATAGVMVCFDEYMQTVENQRSKAVFGDDMNTYPVIQGFSVENLLSGNRLDLPTYGQRRYTQEPSEQPELIISEA